LEVPSPVIEAGQVLVRTLASIISPGTERSMTSLAQSSLLKKARARPDLVRQVIAKAKTEGFLQTARAVRARLGEYLPLGYSAAGVVVEVGEATIGHKPGDIVVTAGAGWANHAEYQAVPGLLCAPVPAHVSPEDAAFATIASIALHGFRLAELEAGSKVVVIGLGLVGQLATRLATAAGCDVAAVDLSPARVEVAARTAALALVDRGADTTEAVMEWARGRGADAILVAASGRSSAAMLRAPDFARDRATVVVIGDVGLDLDRRPLYEKELSLRFARSYGPGRYERTYEEWGVDLPPGYVRWTEGRNLEAILDFLASGRLEVADLVTHRYSIDRAHEAYTLPEKEVGRSLGILITYPREERRPEPPIRIARKAKKTAGLGIGMIGAGSFATSVLVPAFRRAGMGRFVAVTSGSGTSARRLAEREGFERVVAGADAVIEAPDVDVVVIATPHNLHARLASAALRAGKHVYCEKPLALSMAELDEVEEAMGVGKGVLFVGFNRRFSGPVAKVREHFASSSGPLLVSYRVNAGRIAADHWYHDRRQGGRLLGEVCHFVDTCAAIIGEEVLLAQTFGTGGSERLLVEELVVALQFEDGSLASISYSSGGGPAMAKERIEVLGRGRSAVIDDFSGVTLDRETTTIRPKDKGADAIVRAFATACRGERPIETWPMTSSLATLRAAASLTSLIGQESAG
jgi:hypothetical protein